MKALYIEATEDTPYVKLDKEKNIFEIGKRSLPENAIAFYEPVINWLKEYKTAPLSETKFYFKFEYFNTASAKQIAKILLELQEISKIAKVNVCWYFAKDDTDMYASGLRFSKLLNIPFEFHEM
ncbi:MAG: DUF1987 domain-containing protein [Bacteroidales bacterium]|nr:DUF1987 domain-containing protein [Bacteroidales bacterium]